MLANNTSGNHGGGMYLADHAVVNLIATRIRDNAAQNNVDGGGIDFEDDISATITESGIFRNNSDDEGGDLYFEGNDTIQILHSTVMSNTSGDEGGGLFTDGEGMNIVTIENSRFSDNSAALNGGGIHSDSASGGTTDLLIMSSLIFSNTAGNRGGGLANERGKQAALVNSTVSGNSADFGGGLHTRDAVTLTFSAIAHNTALTGTAGIEVVTYTSGMTMYTGTLVLANSIIANLTGANCSFVLPNTAFDLGYNIEDANTCDLSMASSMANTDPLLDPLADHGGPWLPGDFQLAAHALPPGSPALDQIPPGTNECGTGISQDQRGVPRPMGVGCDVGAYELGFFGFLPTIRR